eukprot:5878652-Karenia_brevis.AAC.1
MQASSGAVLQAAERLDGIIHSIVQQYEVTHQVGSAWDKLEKTFLAEPVLCWPFICPCTSVGVWSGNRGGLGFSVSQAIQNGTKHVQAGYSYKKASAGAWAVLMTAHKNCEHEKEFNSKLSISQGLDDLTNLLQ